ncbi:MAG: methylmalonyl-CoA epimerase [Ilumatobacteraceae bacterium]|nr:methylmalonyl-CoA epimerase [Ilumatobacteraceae bacterium]
MGIQAKNPNEDDPELETSFSGEPIDEAFDGGLDAAVLTDVDHIAIVVDDLDEAIAEHRDTFGVLVEHREEMHGEGYEVAFLVVGGSTIQLIAPTSEDSEFTEFLAEGGPGLHHIGYRVDDVAGAIGALASAGKEVLDEEPATGPRGSKIAFVHPDTSFGVLVQLVER